MVGKNGKVNDTIEVSALWSNIHIPSGGIYEVKYTHCGAYVCPNMEGDGRHDFHIEYILLRKTLLAILIILVVLSL